MFHYPLAALPFKFTYEAFVTLFQVLLLFGCELSHDLVKIKVLQFSKSLLLSIIPLSKVLSLSMSFYAQIIEKELGNNNERRERTLLKQMVCQWIPQWSGCQVYATSYYKNTRFINNFGQKRFLSYKK
uniref:Uncharacterized protein n=1 Tax=Heterorhabditis bacteriophora TaxID=37862 RepID=A0A1I7WEP4_HETBA